MVVLDRCFTSHVLAAIWVVPKAASPRSPVSPRFRVPVNCLLRLCSWGRPNLHLEVRSCCCHYCVMSDTPADHLLRDMKLLPPPPRYHTTDDRIRILRDLLPRTMLKRLGNEPQVRVSNQRVAATRFARLCPVLISASECCCRRSPKTYSVDPLRHSLFAAHSLPSPPSYP